MIQQIVTTFQQIVITFPQTVITFPEDIRLVRKLVNRGQNVANALYIVQHFRKSLQRFLEYVDLSENGQSVTNVLINRITIPYYFLLFYFIYGHFLFLNHNLFVSWLVHSMLFVPHFKITPS
jgi:hypothetical protein